MPYPKPTSLSCTLHVNCSNSSSFDLVRLQTTMCSKGHVLSHDLTDSADTIRATRDMVRKANCLLTTFWCADSLVKTHLFRSYCLSLYGAPLWQLSTKALKSLEVSFNMILRKIWHLPPDSHTSIVHCTSYLSSVFNMVYSRCSSLIHHACNSSSYVVTSIFF